MVYKVKWRNTLRRLFIIVEGCRRYPTLAAAEFQVAKWQGEFLENRYYIEVTQ